LRLASASDERRQPINVAFIIRRLKLRPRLCVLRLALGLMLVAGVERLLLRIPRRERLAVSGTLFAVALFVTLFGNVSARVGAGLLLIIGLALTKLLLSCSDQTKVMLCVLIVILRRNWITGTLRIAGELQIFFGDMRSRAANFHVWSVGLIYPGQGILMVVMMAAFAIATPHALVLTVSHDLLFANPLVCDGNSTAISLTFISLTFVSLTFVTSTGRAFSGPPFTMHRTGPTVGASLPLTSCTQAPTALDCGVANL
jgi:hypothetical protein